MTTQDLRIAVNAAIKNLGLKRKDVSVRVYLAGFEDAVRITAKHEDVDLKALDAAMDEFRKVDRCERSGEILSGGNVFINVVDVNGYTNRWCS